MLLHTSFQLNLYIVVKIKHTLHCLYIELYEESVVFGVVVLKTSMLDSHCLGGPLAKVGLSANFGVLVCKASQLYYLGGPSARWSAYMGYNGKHLKLPFNSTGTSTWGLHQPGDLHIWALIVNIWNCHSDQIADMGVPSAKVGSSAKVCVLVCKASLLSYLGGPLAKVGLSAKFWVLVFKASLLYYQGVHLPGNLPIWALMVNIQNCHSDQLADLGGSICVPVFKISLLYYSGGFICQVICKDQLSQQYYILHLANMSPHSWNCHVWGVLGGVEGGYIWHDCTMLTDYLLPSLFRNNRKFPPFHAEYKMVAKYIP